MQPSGQRLPPHAASDPLALGPAPQIGSEAWQNPPTSLPTSLRASYCAHSKHVVKKYICHRIVLRKTHASQRSSRLCPEREPHGSPFPFLGGKNSGSDSQRGSHSP